MAEQCVERRIEINASHFVVRREPSQAAFCLKHERSNWVRSSARVKEGLGMRAHRVFMSLAISIGCGIAIQNAAFPQEYRGTMEQQMACTPDVWRLCSAQVPDVDRIVACLQRNTPQLSGRCRAVFEQSANSPRRRDDQPPSYDRNYVPRRDRDYGYDRGYRPRPYDDDE